MGPILARVVYFTLGLIVGIGFNVARAAEPQTLKAEIYFDTDKSEVKPSEHKKLHDVAAFLVHHQAASIIIGNADKRASRLYNLDLGFRRAESVRAFLVELGVDPKAIIIAASYGEEKPLAPNDNLKEHLAVNRRADVITIFAERKEVVVEKLVVRRHRVSVLGGYAPSGLKPTKQIGPNTFEVKEDFDPELGVSYSFLTPLFNNRLSITAAGFTNKSGFLGLGLDF